jgi:hypothetical protein
MRLRRDSQGNYSYQFVADNDEISKIRDEIDVLENKLYNFDKKAFKDNLEDIEKLTEQYLQDLKELQKIIDPEERAAKEKMINEIYFQDMELLTEKHETFKKNLIDSTSTEIQKTNDDNATSFEEATDREINKIMTELVPQWNTGVAEMADSFGGDGKGSFKSQVTVAVKKLKDVDEDYRKDLKTVEAVGGQVFGTLGERAESFRTKELRDLITDNQKLLEEYQKQEEEIRDNYTPILEDLKGVFSDLCTEITNATNALVEYQKQAALAAQKEKQYTTPKMPDLDNTTSSSKGVDSQSTSSGSGSGSGGSFTGGTAAGATGILSHGQPIHNANVDHAADRAAIANQRSAYDILNNATSSRSYDEAMGETDIAIAPRVNYSGDNMLADN